MTLVSYWDQQEADVQEAMRRDRRRARIALSLEREAEHSGAEAETRDGDRLGHQLTPVRPTRRPTGQEGR